jgi:ABC-type uncharacterized transport system permease subunit
MEQVQQNGSKAPNSENAWTKPLISIGLGLGLAFSLLPKSHQRAKFDISEILTTVWLVYSIYYKDYPVMVICTIILLYSLSQTPSEQTMAWP